MLTKSGMRPNHIVAGTLVFCAGLFFTLKNSLYVLEFIKGGLHPLFLLIGLTAAVAAFLGGSRSVRGLNISLAVIFTALGGFGLYDEFYTTMDFIHGFLPLFLIVAGLFSFIHGITNLKQ